VKRSKYWQCCWRAGAHTKLKLNLEHQTTYHGNKQLVKGCVVLSTHNPRRRSPWWVRRLREGVTQQWWYVIAYLGRKILFQLLKMRWEYRKISVEYWLCGRKKQDMQMGLSKFCELWLYCVLPGASGTQLACKLK